jgi:hypothetical protein
MTGSSEQVYTMATDGLLTQYLKYCIGILGVDNAG